MEKENMKLHQEIENYKIGYRVQDDRFTRSFSEAFESLKNSIDNNSAMRRQDDEEFNIGNIEEYFQKSSDEIIKSHSDVIDKAFDFILEYAVPKFAYKYFNLFDQPLNLSYESIKKFTVKAFVVTPKMTKNSIIFRGGYDKGYKIFIADENLFVCILIYLFVS